MYNVLKEFFSVIKNIFNKKSIKIINNNESQESLLKMSNNNINISHIKLEKRIFDVTFKQKNLFIDDTQSFSVQSPSVKLPDDAKFRWKSSNTKIIAIADDGKLIGKINPGVVRLTLVIIENEYYKETSGYYNITIYGLPDLVIPDFIIKNNTVTQRVIDENRIVWKPVYKDDFLTVKWKTKNCNIYKYVSKTVVALKSADTSNEYESIGYDRSIVDQEIETTFKPQARLFDMSKLRLTITIYGYNDKMKQYDREIFIENEVPENIGTLISTGTIRYFLTSIEKEITTCQQVQKETKSHPYVTLHPRTELKLKSTELLLPLIVSHTIDILSSTSMRVVRHIDCNDEISLTANTTVNSDNLTKKFILQEYCTVNDSGRGYLITKLQFGQQIYTNQIYYTWTGLGISSFNTSSNKN